MRKENEEMKSLRLLLVCVFAIAGSAVHAQEKNLVANGDFEDCRVSSGSWDIFQNSDEGQYNFCEALGWTVEWVSDAAFLSGLTQPEVAFLEIQNGILKHANTGVQAAELDTDWDGPAAPDACRFPLLCCRRGYLGCDAVRRDPAGDGPTGLLFRGGHRRRVGPRARGGASSSQ